MDPQRNSRIFLGSYTFWQNFDLPFANFNATYKIFTQWVGEQFSRTDLAVLPNGNKSRDPVTLEPEKFAQNESDFMPLFVTDCPFIV